MDGANTPHRRQLHNGQGRHARAVYLVVPLAHKATAMRIKETTGSSRAWSCAVTRRIGNCHPPSDVDSTTKPRTRPTTPSCRTSRMATRTTTTRTTSTGCGQYADQPDAEADFSFEELVHAYRRTRANHNRWRHPSGRGARLPDQVLQRRWPGPALYRPHAHHSHERPHRAGDGGRRGIPDRRYRHAHA